MDQTASNQAIERSKAGQQFDPFKIYSRSIQKQSTNYHKLLSQSCDQI